MTVAAVFEASRREGREPIALYRALANAPALLESYRLLARSLRYDATTDRGLRELIILRTAQLTRSDYEWAHHVWMAASAGVAPEKVRELAAWETSDLFDDCERAALRCTEQVHQIGVTDETFAELTRVVGEAGALEIVVTASVYQAVARMIQAFGLEVEAEYRQYLGDSPSTADRAT